MDRINGGGNRLPFQQLSNRQLRNVTRDVRTRGRGGRIPRIIETLLPQSSPLAYPAGTLYTNIWEYRFSSDSDDFGHAVGSLFAEMSRRLGVNDRARIRITYRDRSHITPNARSTSNVFDGLEEFINDGLISLIEGIQFLFSSNEQITFEDIIVLFDINPDGLIGGGGPRIWNPEIPAMLRENCKGVFVVPSHGLLCGWICVSLFLIQNGYLSPPKFSATNFAREIKYERKLISAGLFFRNTMVKTSALNTATDLPLIVDKFKQLRIVTMSVAGHVISEISGSEYMLTDNYNENRKFTLYMIYDATNQHFSWLRYPALWKCGTKKFWCYGCHRAIRSDIRHSHRCTDLSCIKCNMHFETQKQLDNHKVNRKGEENKCTECLKTFPNSSCFYMHTQRVCRKSGKKVVCENCGIHTFVRSKHTCLKDSEIKCDNCNDLVTRYDLVNNIHRCYIQKLEYKPEADEDNDEDPMEFYAFDFESQFVSTEQRLVTNHDGDAETVDFHTHEINFVVATNCFTNAQYKFRTVDEFVDWNKDLGVKSVFIAHNLKGYDGRLLFDHYIKKLKIPPSNVLWNGTKIMSMKVGQVIYRDSLLHIATALENFPKIFGLDETQFAKGYFPYTFNVPANQQYIGTAPAVNFFNPNGMSKEKKRKFFEWYDEIKDDVYDFRAELEKYCIADTEILAKSLNVYMSEGIADSGMNPMKYTTIASYVFAVYRTHHIPENTIGVLTEHETNFAKRAMHGGRTDVRQMMKFYTRTDVNNGKYAKYQDVQSLYPTIQFYKELPVGIPRTHIFNETDQPSVETIQSWFGYVECDIQPTTYMHHPIILDNASGKLQGNLYAKTKIVITTLELHKALEHGYMVTRIYEYHEYDKSTDLFKSYIRKYLKTKIECGGLPKFIVTDTDWDVFADYHLNELGIRLDRTEMVKNPGKKQLSKLMLNSLWGKFAQSRTYTQHKVIDNITAFRSFERSIDDGEMEVIYGLNIDNNTYMAIYKSTGEWEREKSYNVNIALAGYITAWGGTILGDEMIKLDRRVIYHDTDSIVYEHDPDLYNIPEGRYLGEWEDECGGRPIVKFVSTGPKTYAYAYIDKDEPIDKPQDEDYEYWGEGDKMNKLIYDCKCKGFSLNSRNAEIINFDGLHKLLIGQKDYLTTKSLKMVWYRAKSTLKSYDETKFLGFSYDKCLIEKYTYMTFPHGSQDFGIDLDIQTIE